MLGASRPAASNLEKSHDNNPGQIRSRGKPNLRAKTACRSPATKAASNIRWTKTFDVSIPSHCFGRPLHWLSIAQTRTARLRIAVQTARYAGTLQEDTISNSGSNFLTAFNSSAVFG